MYEFAILLLGGLVVMKSTDFLGRMVKELGTPAIALFATMAVGAGYAFLFDFSVFASWGVGVRSEIIGTLGTGLLMGAASYIWDAMFDYLHGHRHAGTGHADVGSLGRAA